MEKFTVSWKYPYDFKNHEILLNDGKYRTFQNIFRDENGIWYSSYMKDSTNFDQKMLEKSYQYYLRKQKLKRILNGKI